MKPPVIVPVEKLPPEVIKAAYEMIAQALREKAEVLNIRLDGVSYDGKPIGDYEISIRRTDI